MNTKEFLSDKSVWEYEDILSDMLEEYMKELKPEFRTQEYLMKVCEVIVVNIFNAEVE